MRLFLTLALLLLPFQAHAQIAMSDYLENELLDHVLKGDDYVEPTTVYMALFSATPSDSGGGTELSGNNYSRQAITYGSAASGGKISNTATVTFTATGSNWTAATHYGLFDASTSGNLLFWGALNATLTVEVGTPEEFSAGTIETELD